MPGAPQGSRSQASHSATATTSTDDVAAYTRLSHRETRPVVLGPTVNRETQEQWIITAIETSASQVEHFENNIFIVLASQGGAVKDIPSVQT